MIWPILFYLGLHVISLLWDCMLRFIVIGLIVRFCILYIITHLQTNPAYGRYNQINDFNYLLLLLSVGDRAFPVAASRTCNSLPLHITSAPSPQTIWRRGWGHSYSAAVSRPNLLFPITDATLFSA